MATDVINEANNFGFLQLLIEMGETPEDYPAWRLIYNTLHTVNCKNGPSCDICIETAALLEHQKTCDIGPFCTVPNCWAQALICDHFMACPSDTCPGCMEIITRMNEHDAEMKANN